MLLEKVRKVSILGEDDRIRFSGCSEDREIFGLTQAQLPDGLRRDAKRIGDPLRQGRRKVSIDPDRHAASTGWSMRLDAY